MKLRHLDLFSGIGGFSLGLESTGGFETVAFCDIEKYCLQVLEKRFPGVPRYTDIKELNYDKIKSDGLFPIDIITGGYPCQPFSVAGRKKGEEDPRHLWPEMFRLVQELRPSWVIGENVSGHIKLGLDTVLKNLESEGYSARTFSISASSVGANHQRERVWIVANAKQDNYLEQVRRRNEEESRIQKKYREEHSQSRQSSGTSEVWQKSNGHENVEDTRQHGRRLEPSRNQEGSQRGTFEKTKRSSAADKTSRSSTREETLADTHEGLIHRTQDKIQARGHTSDSSSTTKRKETLANAECIGQQRQGELVRSSSSTKDSDGQTSWSYDGSQRAEGWWNIEPNVGRVAHGVSSRVDRLKSLGNSLVPQIPYYIGLSILRTYDMANTDGEMLQTSKKTRDDG